MAAAAGRRGGGGGPRDKALGSVGRRVCGALEEGRDECLLLEQGGGGVALGCRRCGGARLGRRVGRKAQPQHRKDAPGMTGSIKIEIVIVSNEVDRSNSKSREEVVKSSSSCGARPTVLTRDAFSGPCRDVGVLLMQNGGCHAARTERRGLPAKLAGG